MTIKVTIKHDGPHGKIAVDQGPAALLDANMEVIREGKESVTGITTTILDPGEFIDHHIWGEHEMVIREVSEEPLPVVASD